MRLGAFDHLTKPIRRDAVMEVLARALRRVMRGAMEPQAALAAVRRGRATA